MLKQRGRKILSAYCRHGRSDAVEAARQSLLDAAASIVHLMFRYQPPVLRLSASQRELLTVALETGTDAEIAATSGLPLPTIKKRWLSIYRKVGVIQPDILGTRDEDDGDGDDVGGRGRQKRHRVLAYLRAHSEELTPFAYSRPAKPASPSQHRRAGSRER